MNKITRELLEDIAEWIETGGQIDGVWFEDKIIIDEIRKTIENNA